MDEHVHALMVIAHALRADLRRGARGGPRRSPSSSAQARDPRPRPPVEPARRSTPPDDDGGRHRRCPEGRRLTSSRARGAREERRSRAAHSSASTPAHDLEAVVEARVAPDREERVTAPALGSSQP